MNVGGLLAEFLATTVGTIRDLLPIAAILLGFQFLVIREPPPHLRILLNVKQSLFSTRAENIPRRPALLRQVLASS